MDPNTLREGGRFPRDLWLHPRDPATAPWILQGRRFVCRNHGNMPEIDPLIMGKWENHRKTIGK